MKKILIILASLIFIGCSKETETERYVPNEVVVLTVDDSILFSLINDYRVNNNLSRLKLESLATKLASEHVDYMILENNISHDYFVDRYNRSNAERMGEIVASNYLTPTSILNAYLGSPKHKKVIDNPNFTHIGLSTRERFNCCIFTSYK